MSLVPSVRDAAASAVAAVWQATISCLGICGCVVFSFVTANDLFSAFCFVIRVHRCSEDPTS